MSVVRDNVYRVVLENEHVTVEERWGPVRDHTQPGERFPDGWYTGQEFSFHWKAPFRTFSPQPDRRDAE